MTSSSPELILASTSPYRRSLLERLGLPFSVHAPEVDETPLEGESAIALAERLARAKAGAVGEAFPAAVVIGSDQVADLQGRIVGKPGSLEENVAQLLRLAGKVAWFHTAVCVVCRNTGLEHAATVGTEVSFRQLREDEARRQVARDPAPDCAGGFKAEGAAPLVLEYVRSDDPTALIGLPLIALSGMLRKAGFQLP